MALAELLLVSLYDLSEEQPHSYFFFQLDQIGTRVGATDMEQLTKAAHILEDRGFAMLSASPLSILSAMISSDGISFVESGGETGIIKTYRNNPREVIDIVCKEVQAPPESVSNSIQEDIPATVQALSLNETMQTILSRIGSVLADDSSIITTVREDAIKDLESLKIQLSRSSQNWRLVEMLLDALAEIPSLLPSLKDLALVLRRLE
ncbi:MAG: hypothetical protein A4E59_01065 [Syntrophorhabdus sp. PtaB.Bin027]|nr:MAG: hypothetical protein A4E59_01065 [Syntrophorhabdus sp. PtaB.Bin027]OQB77250.1 MAG: hypothetical protein BWX92_01062 [Deltaproteobacteria bacterium ADurb.Bin135]